MPQIRHRRVPICGSQFHHHTVLNQTTPRKMPAPRPSSKKPPPSDALSAHTKGQCERPQAQNSGGRDTTDISHTVPSVANPLCVSASGGRNDLAGTQSDVFVPRKAKTQRVVIKSHLARGEDFDGAGKQPRHSVCSRSWQSPSSPFFFMSLCVCVCGLMGIFLMSQSFRKTKQ